MDKPKFIIEKSKVFSQVEILKEIFDEVSYSWKTNPKIGEILNESETCYISVCGVNELQQVKDKSKVWYFPTQMHDNELEEVLINCGIRNFVVDNPIVLDELIDFVTEKNIKINLLLRMKLRENSIFTGRHYVFGMRTEEIKKWIDTLSGNDMIVSLGVHFHRKTQNVSEWNLREEVEQSLGDDYLSKIDVINLGGGLPAKYVNSHDNELDSIFSKIKELRDYTDNFGIKLVIEPGRFIAAPSVRLKCRVITVYDNTCFVNVSVFNGMLDTIVANVKLIVEEEIDKSSGSPFVIKGCTPDSADILRYRVYLKNPKVGDVLTFLNCGAYTYQTDFCVLERIEYEVVEKIE